MNSNSFIFIDMPSNISNTKYKILEMSTVVVMFKTGLHVTHLNAIFCWITFKECEYEYAKIK